MKAATFLIFILSLPCWLGAQSGKTNRFHTIMEANRIHTVIGNWGVVGEPSDKGPRGAWPNITNGYLGDFSILVGARIDNDSLSFSSVETCPVIRPTMSGLDSDPATGELWTFEPLPLGSQNLARSTDPATWPGSWSHWPYLTDATLEVYFEIDDNNDMEFNYSAKNSAGIRFKPDGNDSTRNGLGLKVECRYCQYDVPGLEDVLFQEYTLINEGTTTYRHMIFGGLAGTYVGVTGSDNTPREYDDDAAFFNLAGNYIFWWDWPMDNKHNPYWEGKPGFAALAFLHSPGNPFDGIDNDRDNAALPGSSAPFFNSQDFEGHTIQAGETIILIENNFERSKVTVPSSPFQVTTCGKSFTIEPGVTYVREGNPGNPNSGDGIDNDFDGLIDENMNIHYRVSALPLHSPVEIANTLEPTQYIDYFTGQGESDPGIDETGDDVDETGLASFDYFVPANNIPMSNDEALMDRMHACNFSVPGSYRDGRFFSGEDGDVLFSSGPFTLLPGQRKKVVLGLAYADYAELLADKVKLARAISLDSDVQPELDFSAMPSGEFTGNSISITWQSDITVGNVIIEYSAYNGRFWRYLGAVPVSQGAYDWDISGVPDGCFYKVRIRHSLRPAEEKTSPRFTINHPGNGFPGIYFTNKSFVPDSATGKLTVSWIADDPDGDPLDISLMISTTPDTTWQSIATVSDSGSLALDTRKYPNTGYALLRLMAWDGRAGGLDISPRFTIHNSFPAVPDTLRAHISGIGSGIIRPVVVDSAALTGHNYRVTFNDTGEVKSYRVTDLNIGKVLVWNCTQLDSSILGPVFDGVRLLVQDANQRIIDNSRSGWSSPEVNLRFDVFMESIELPDIGEVKPVAFPYDYQIEFYDHVVDTSLSFFRELDLTPAAPTSFKIKNTFLNCYSDFVWIPSKSGQTTIGSPDFITLVETDIHGVQQLAGRLILTDSIQTETIMPSPGDTLFLRFIHPFSHYDQYEFTTADMLVGICPAALLSQTFNLQQNYPNPFNPATMLTFTIPRVSRVNLVVYDVLGRKVKTLVDEKLAAGEHQVHWNGNNDSGNRVASGIYIAVFRSADIVKTRKMILLK